ncbi:MAG: LysR family transcriptional regulator [Burkholderiaceae bacterium]|nr:MAG: LysR family transcriptional regulator [Burkholderiaceae bacterium]MBE7427115.1 LysR family transcriptional regulator [Ideonella sp.]MCC7288329.1 LysR family transcriptional regulator [Burkholderiaceae bacterium]
MTDKTLAQRRRRVRLRDLETLLAMVQAGGLRKAAGALHLSQPAISKAMRELEDALGVRLLERGRRGTEPTIHGEVLVRRAQAMLDELHNALLELDWLSDPEAGEVRVGGGDVQQAGILAMTAQGLLDSHPHMRITFEAAQSRELIEQMLPQRLVDFAVTRPATLPLPSDIEAEPLYCERLHIVVGKAHALAGRRKLTLAALQGERWILSRNELMAGSPLLQAFADAGLPLPARRVESSTLSLRQRLLASGHFVTCVPHTVLPFLRQTTSLRMLPVSLPAWATPTMLFRLRGRVASPAADVFIDVLREKASVLRTDAEGAPA